MRTLGMLILLLGLVACGDDGGTVSDAAVSADATVDADLPDADQASACQTLCDCASTYCEQDENDCLDECASLPSSVISCRITHCGYAQQPEGASLHCPHVAGDPDAPGTPPDCVYDLGDAGVGIDAQ